jgi:hypothetical protein
MEKATPKNEIELTNLTSALGIPNAIAIRYDNKGNYKNLEDVTSKLNDFIKVNENNKLMLDFDYLKAEVVFVFLCLPNALRIAFCDKTSIAPVMFSAIDPKHSQKRLKLLADKYISFYLKDKEFANYGLRYFDITQKVLDLDIINQTAKDTFVANITLEFGEEPITQMLFKNPIEIKLLVPEGATVEVGKPYRVWVHTFEPWLGSVWGEIEANHFQSPIIFSSPPNKI